MIWDASKSAMLKLCAFPVVVCARVPRADPVRMKRKTAEPPCPVHAVWRTVRGPFRVMGCAGGKHQWERYDCNYAGCLRCGGQHRCETNLVDSKCPLAELDDGSICCTVRPCNVPYL